MKLRWGYSLSKEYVLKTLCLIPCATHIYTQTLTQSPKCLNECVVIVHASYIHLEELLHI